MPDLSAANKRTAYRMWFKVDLVFLGGVGTGSTTTYAVTLILAATLGLADGVAQSSLFGEAGCLPARFTQASTPPSNLLHSSLLPRVPHPTSPFSTPLWEDRISHANIFYPCPPPPFRGTSPPFCTFRWLMAVHDQLLLGFAIATSLARKHPQTPL